MKRSLLAGVGLVALLAVPAAAADLPRQAPMYKAPAYVSGFNWTGAYIGLHGGYSWGGSGDIDLRGGFIGGQIGYNWQGAGSPWVFGIEVDSAWADLGRTEAITTPAGIATVSTDADYQGSLRARIGYAFQPRTMAYVTGGLAWMNNEVSITVPVGGFAVGLSDSKMHWGGTVGAGIEHAFAPNLTGRIEYVYAGYGSKDYFSGIGGGVGLDADSHAIKVGVNYLIR
jgi:outer membrane immunogenic protein